MALNHSAKKLATYQHRRVFRGVAQPEMGHNKTTTVTATEVEIAEEIQKRLKAQAEYYAQRFDGPSDATKKRWQKKNRTTS